MPIIRTVLGDIAPESLGFCLPHEHLYGWPPPAFATDDLTLDSEDAAIAELRFYREAGGRALVEMTTPDYNRDAAALGHIARASGVHIISATGYNKEKFSAPFLQDAAPEALARRFIRDVTTGMDGTDCRAGLIKASMALHTGGSPNRPRKVDSRGPGLVQSHPAGGRTGLHLRELALEAGQPPPYG